MVVLDPMKLSVGFCGDIHHSRDGSTSPIHVTTWKSIAKGHGEKMMTDTMQAGSGEDGIDLRRFSVWLSSFVSHGSSFSKKQFFSAVVKTHSGH